MTVLLKSDNNGKLYSFSALNFANVKGVSTDTLRTCALSDSYFFILSRASHNCAVQTPVKAAGKKFNTTFLPRKSLSDTCFFSSEKSVKSGAN